MTRQECLHVPAIASRLLRHHLEQLDHAASAPPRSREDPHAHLVCLTFLSTVELQEHATREQAGCCLCRGRAATVAEQCPKQTEPPFRHHSLREPVCAMTTGNVSNLMCD